MAQWSINGPDQLLLNIEQVAHLLFVSESTLRARIRAGEFPHPNQTGRTPYWTAPVIAAYLLLEPLMYPGEMEEPEDDSPPPRPPTPPPTKRKPKKPEPEQGS